MKSQSKGDNIKNMIKNVANLSYLVGEPGDLLERKIFLIGCDTSPVVEALEEKKGNIELVDFIRALALSTRPKYMDFFIEAPFQTMHYGSATLSVPNRYAKHKDDIMSRLRDIFESSLLKNKSFSKEPMRVHYADIRDVVYQDNFTSYCEAFLRDVVAGKVGKMEEWKAEPWIIDPALIEEEIISILGNARISDKIGTLHKNVEGKFFDLVIEPISEEVLHFFQLKENAIGFERVKAAVVTKKILPEVTALAITLLKKLTKIQTSLMEAYTICRMLKLIAANDGERTHMALPKGEYLRQSCVLMNSSSILAIQEMLINFGFKVKCDEKDKILASKVSSSFKDFVDNEEEPEFTFPREEGAEA